MSEYPDINGPSLDSDPVLAKLLEQLRASHNDAICCTLLYGSCLRSGDIYDGLLDLYLICDDYSAAYGKGFMATANWLLPPNVFYAEASGEGRTLRSKVTMISMRDFQRGCSKAWFQSYIWGRFSQPTHLLYCRDQQAGRDVKAALMSAAKTFLQNATPSVPETGTVNALWKEALELSYATELRTERTGRAAELVAAAADFYGYMTRAHADSLGFDFEVYDVDGELHYRSQVHTMRRHWATWSWALRRGQGKLLSVARLIKALFTFEGGLDYIAWKLERHSGEEIVIPDKVRRAPLIFMWGYYWGLYRRGIFK